MLYNTKVRYINLPNMSELFQTFVFWCKRLALENIKRLLYNALMVGECLSSLVFPAMDFINFLLTNKFFSGFGLSGLHDYLWHQHFPLTKQIFSGSGSSGSSWSSLARLAWPGTSSASSAFLQSMINLLPFCKV